LHYRRLHFCENSCFSSTHIFSSFIVVVDKKNTDKKNNLHCVGLWAATHPHPITNGLFRVHKYAISFKI